MKKIERAIVSVYDKDGVVDFVKTLVSEFGVEVFSTGGTARTLKSAGIDVVDIGDYTGYGSMMDGRVKSLHPKVFGGILARRDVEGDLQQLAEHRIDTFDMVVVNFYPFERVVAEGADLPRALENIDIGGPSMVRAAAKNHPFVAVVTSPTQYDAILKEMRENDGALSEETRRRLATSAFALTASYDAQINAYLRSIDGADFPERLLVSYELVGELRYGENPHQKAAFYKKGGVRGALASAEVLSANKALSFNNLLDAEGALNCVRLLKKPAVAVIKHTVPCGLAFAERLEEAFVKAHAGDPVSAFGGIVALNRRVDAETARLIATGDNFFEVVIAPDYEEEALEVLKSGAKWSKNLRILKVDSLLPPDEMEIRYISGGLLLQQPDSGEDEYSEWQVVTKKSPSDRMMEELRFAFLCVRYVKSNGIVIVKDGALVGSGGGQTSRVDAAKVAVMKAGERAKGAVAASDAFFPFPDGIEVLADAGVVAVVQPGGSVRDKEAIEAADEAGMVMLFTGRRHFRH